MLGSLARRQRRPLWGALSLLLAIGTGLVLFAAARAKSEAAGEAAIDARLAAQTELAPMLQPRDLMAPIIGQRAEDLAAGIDRAITSVSTVDEVRIYTEVGRILYAEDPSLVGTRPSYLRDLTFEVANGQTVSRIRAGLMQTYVPLWLAPGGETVVAELSQAYDPIVAGVAGGWNRLGLVTGGLLLLTLGMVVVTTRASAIHPMAVQVYGKAVVPPQANRADLRAQEEQRRQADERAKAADERYRTVKEQLREQVEKVRELEGRIAMDDMQTTTNSGELQVLRDQLRDTAERLHKAELDNNALRERLALRQQELETAKHRAAAARADGDMTELKERLEAAERRASEMSRDMEKIEAELEYTTGRFHLSKLSEALREFDNDEESIDIDEEDDLYEHPVVLRSTVATHRKVR